MEKRVLAVASSMLASAVCRWLKGERKRGGAKVAEVAPRPVAVVGTAESPSTGSGNDRKKDKGHRRVSGEWVVFA